MPKPVTINICGVHATARTKTEARAKAEASLLAIVDRTSGSPEILFYRGQAILITPDAYGFSNNLITNQDGTMRAGYVHAGSSSYDTRTGAVRAAYSHLLQIAWTPGVCDIDYLSGAMRLHPGTGHIDRDTVICDTARFIGFQRAWLHAIDIEPAARHTWACEHTDEFAPRIIRAATGAIATFIASHHDAARVAQQQAQERTNA